MKPMTPLEAGRFDCLNDFPPVPGEFKTVAEQREYLKGWDEYRPKPIQEHEIGSAGVGHVNHPHRPGYLYDCPACEAECFCDADSGSTCCIFCSNENDRLLEEC